MPTRQQYVAARIGGRMQQRGETMVLRRTTLSAGPVPYRNPPDVSSDLKVLSGVTVAGQSFLGITGSSIIGRLMAGDKILCTATLGGPVLTTWTVGVMPGTLSTDSDGIIAVDASYHPIVGTPGIYSPDSLAADDHWRAIPVSATGSPDPAASVGNFVTLSYTADQVVFGVPLSFERMLFMNWTEVDSIGVRLAAYNHAPVLPPKVDDQLLIGGKTYSVMSISPIYARGVQLTYTVQCR